MYVVARSFTKRPTLMHVLNASHPDRTLCNVDLTRWSRAYLDEVIPQILCTRCATIVIRDNASRGTVVTFRPNPIPTHPLRSVK